MTGWLRRLLRGSIRTRMTLGVAAVVVLTMGLFALIEEVAGRIARKGESLPVEKGA
jgi:hypothetical protein